MASFRNNPPAPIKTGPFKGLIALRWRHYSGGPHQSGYLPRPTLLDDYTAYEQQCWLDGIVPDAPEVRYADEIDRLRRKRDQKVAEVVEKVTAAKAATMTMREFVGTPDKPGDFFQFARNQMGHTRQDRYFALTSWAVFEPFTTKPMDQLRIADAEKAFAHRLACTACVRRAKNAGRTPGSDIPWDQLVPRTNRDPWDGAGACDDHVAPVTEGTAENDRVTFGAIFNATTTARAEEAGMKPLKKRVADARWFDTICWPDSSDDDLRYALDMVQVQQLCDASPEHLAAVPAFATATLNRAGQELFGPNLGDLAPENPELFSNPASPLSEGFIHIRNFYKRTVRRLSASEKRELARQGRQRRKGASNYTMTAHGKTKKTTRSCPTARWQWEAIRKHVLTFRSAPQDNCPGCQVGHGHWRTDDQVNNPHVWNENGPIRCPMAVDAPIFVDTDGTRHNPERYTNDIWPLICERAGLTEEQLHFKPLPRHFRSTGTTLLLESGVDLHIVVELGGWKDAKMIMQHYRRHRPETLLKIIQEANELLRFALDGQDHEDGLTPEQVLAQVESAAKNRLEFALRQSVHRASKLERLLRAHGVDPDATTATGRVTIGQVAPTKGVSAMWSDDDEVRDVVKQVLFDEGGGVADVIKALGGKPAGSHYKRARAWCERAGCIPFPTKHPRFLKGKERTAFWTSLAQACGVDLARDYPHLLGERWSDPGVIRRGLIECILQGDGQTKTDVLRHIGGPIIGAQGPLAIDRYLANLGVPGFPERKKLANAPRAHVNNFLRNLSARLNEPLSRSDGLGYGGNPKAA